MYVPGSSITPINSFAVGPALNDNRFGSSSEDFFLLTSEVNKYKSRSPEPDVGSRMTRRRFFLGAAASLVCAPAIIRAASIMPVRAVQLGALRPEGEFYRGCFYRSLENDLRAGRAMSVRSNEKIISVAEAYRMVARARAQGWLPR